MFRKLARFFGARKKPAEKPRLLGLHMSQMNTAKAISVEIQKTRDRDNGKFTHER